MPSPILPCHREAAAVEEEAHPHLLGEKQQELKQELKVLWLLKRPDQRPQERPVV
jgi:hypothetical protein